MRADNLTATPAASKHTPERAVIGTVRALVRSLHAAHVHYCHWKSNIALAAGLAGRTDIDLLVHRSDATRFRSVLATLQFKPATGFDGGSHPSTEHYFALDASGVLVHVHAYYRVITGESLAKNYRLPIEDLLLQHTAREHGVPVPSRGAELVVFTLRMMLKHSSSVELALLARDPGQIAREMTWLLVPHAEEEALGLLAEWLPSVDPALFAACVSALHRQASLFRRIVLARRLQRQLRMYARGSRLRASWAGLSSAGRMLAGRVARRPRGLVPQSGGALIAFVGAEASGKSTLIDELVHWSGEHFAVERVHAGKPRSTWLSAVPNLLVPMLRSLLPGHRASVLDACGDADGRSPRSSVFPLTTGFRAVLLAYDRRALLSRAYAHAANGVLVLCDRYPLLSRGAPDGPILGGWSVPRGRAPLHHLLARVEMWLYRRVPPPDLVVALGVPLDVALARNRSRGKREPEEYVRRRHAQLARVDFGGHAVHRLDSGRPLGETLQDAKHAIWSAL